MKISTLFLALVSSVTTALATGSDPDVQTKVDGSVLTENGNFRNLHMGDNERIQVATGGAVVRTAEMTAIIHDGDARDNSVFQSAKNLDSVTMTLKFVGNFDIEKTVVLQSVENVANVVRNVIVKEGATVKVDGVVMTQQELVDLANAQVGNSETDGGEGASGSGTSDGEEPAAPADAPAGVPASAPADSPAGAPPADTPVDTPPETPDTDTPSEPSDSEK